VVPENLPMATHMRQVRIDNGSEPANSTRAPGGDHVDTIVEAS
jgi:hypothetical protein